MLRATETVTNHAILTGVRWVDWALIIGFVGGAIASVKRWIVDPLVKVFGRIGDLFEDVYGEPARQGVDPRPGALQRIDRIEQHIWPKSSG